MVGAGIGGLCLAHGLLRAGAEVTVYERDETLDSRGQGYRLHVDAGPALSACLPPDLYELCIATSGRPSTTMTVVTERLRSLRRTEIGPPADPLDPATLSTSVNRQTFREILAARLDGVLRFGRTCTGFEQDPGGVAIHFSDGSHAEVEVLVAAEGISSPIRRCYLPHARLEDAGVACVYGRTPLTGQTRAWLPERLSGSVNNIMPPRDSFMFTAVWEGDRQRQVPRGGTCGDRLHRAGGEARRCPMGA